MKQTVLVILMLLLLSPPLDLSTKGIQLPEPIPTPQVVVVEEVVVHEVAKVETVSRSLPEGRIGAFKTYMSYKALTNQDSIQWEMQQQATTDSRGFRLYNGKYMIAIGQFYAQHCGVELLITLDTGNVINAVVGDVKQNCHTNSTNQYVEGNYSVLEFIVDVEQMDDISRRMGDVSYSGLEGCIVKIEEVKQ